MAESAVVVNPTVVDESFGVVLLEAQSVGRPVVSTAVGAVATVVREGETALLVPPRDASAMADAIASVLSGTALAEAESVGPQWVASNFTWAGSLDAMERVLESVAR
jgi:glycosyltransferase involved in cell wall biosynthesis